MAGFDTLLLCATPRSGSTLLCSYFRSSGVLGWPESWFRSEDRAEYIQDWGLSDGAGFDAFLAAVKRAGSSQNGVFGVRIMWQTLGELTRDLTPLFPELSGAAQLGAAFGRCAYVHLSRRDKAAQAVSRLRAEQTRFWHRIGDEEERYPGGLADPIYDFARLDTYRQAAERDDAQWSEWFRANGIRPLPVVYEMLAEAPVETVQGILSALGLSLPLGLSLTAQNERLADALNQDWAARYRAETGQG